MARARNILFFANTTHNTQCVADHIAAVQAGSPHNWFVVNSLNNRVAHKLDLSIFDAVGFHYSIRPRFSTCLAGMFDEHDAYYCSKALYEKVRNYEGVVFQFLQDEYQRVNVASEAMVELGVDVLFTIVRPELHHEAYDDPKLKDMKRVTVLTGYAPAVEGESEFVPLSKRSTDLFYRSRELPYWLGSLGNEKIFIADEILRRAKEHDLTVDISVREEDRIYGDEWDRRMANCRATLGTESGASIWDRDGSIERAVDEVLGENPEATFEEVFEAVLKPHDGKLIYSGISPRVFEAAALKTPLIMFPGWYNGLVKPGVHYVELEKDFSNFDKVLKTLRDNTALEAIADNAYRDLIVSGDYHESKLGAIVSDALEDAITSKQFKATADAAQAQQAVHRIEGKYRLQNWVLNAASELRFAWGQFMKIMSSPRFKGMRKFERLFEGFKRYLTYLKPRIAREGGSR